MYTFIKDIDKDGEVFKVFVNGERMRGDVVRNSNEEATWKPWDKGYNPSEETQRILKAFNLKKK